MTHTYTHIHTQARKGFWANRHTSFVRTTQQQRIKQVVDTRFGCEMGAGRHGRAVGLLMTVSGGIQLFISLPLMLLCTASLFVSQPLCITLHFHIYYKNTAVIWGFHHRCGGGLKVAEGERKGIDCDNPQNCSFAIHAHKGLLKGSGSI